MASVGGWCGRCKEYFLYLKNGLCRECYWKDYIKSIDAKDDEARFLGLYDNCYGDDR